MSQHTLPTHVGLILDGNRRWAKKHGLPVYEGHMAGYAALKDVIYALSDAGVEYISSYTFSTENWRRTESEVQGLMKMIRQLLKTEVKELIRADFRLLVMGDREGLPDDIAAMIDDVQEQSRHGQRATLVMCFNYGGQQEIVRAVNRLVAEGAAMTPLSVESFAHYLDHPEVPPCDLIVRTSGEQRLSNFMLWRSAYSEFLFLDKLWPDMRPEDVTGILEEYNRRNRRHGG